MNGATAWLSCHVNRWHGNPWMNPSHDPIVGHSGRVVILMLALWPDTTGEAIKAAVLHDLAESVVGDMRGDVKRNNPLLAAELDKVEASERRKMRLPESPLSPQEAARLKFCDKLDAYLFMLLRRPDRQHWDGWPEAKEWLLVRAGMLGAKDEVIAILEAVG